MKIKTLFAVLLLSILFSNLSAQKSDLTYQILRNNPLDANNMVLKLNPFYTDIYYLNLNFGYDLGMEYTFNNMLNLKLNYRSAYADRMDENYPDLGTSFEDSKSFMNAEVIAQYIFYKDVFKDEITVSLKQVGNTEYVTNVTADNFTAFSFRLGYNPMRSHVSENTPLNGGVYFLEGNKVNFNDDVDDIDGGTMMSSNNIVIGASRIKKTDLKVNVSDGYGVKDIALSKEIYFDVLYSTGVSLSNMIVNRPVYVDNNGDIHFDDGGGQYTYQEMGLEYAVDEHVDKSNLGLRIGYRVSTLKKFGINYGLELGSMPGPGTITDNIYLLATVGINLSTKL